MNWRGKLIEILGGYPDIDSAIEAIKGMDKEVKHQILTLAVRKLFNTVGPDDILKVAPDGKTWMLGRKALSDGEKNLLIAEAMQFFQGKLWEVLQTDVRYRANLGMFLKGTTPDDIIAGKLSLFLLDVLNTRLKSMQKGHAMFNSGN